MTSDTPTLTANPQEVRVTADDATPSTPTAQIEITLHSSSGAGAYIVWRHEGSAITAMNYSTVGTKVLLTLSFQDPSVVGAGTYPDTVTLAICTDSTCAQMQSGSEITIPVTYTVTLTATAKLTADPATTGIGMPTTLTWSSTDAQACAASGDWSGTLASSGSLTVTPTRIGTQTYSISCSNPGAPAQASVSVTAVDPSVASFSAFPSSVVLGKAITLRWQGSYVTGCTGSGAWSGSLTASGDQTITPTSVGTATFTLVCANSITSTAQQTATVTVESAPASPPATAYRMNERHDGVLITTDGIQYPKTSEPTWTVDLGAPVSYPLVVDGRVLLTTANPDQSYGNELYALDAQTGGIVWGPIEVPGTYFGSGLTYDDGRVFVLMFGGDVHAFNASNGAALWTSQLPGYWYEATPNAYGGLVFASGNYGLSAVDETDGTVLWTTGAGGTTGWASPAVQSDGVYIEGSNCQPAAFDPTFGTRLWHQSASCSGAWDYASIVKDGILLGRQNSALRLYDAATGAPGAQLASARAPAVTDTSVIALNAGTLSSTRLSDLVQTWTFAGDGNLVTAPVVVNDTVFVGSSSGNVYGLNVTTGSEIWSGVAHQAIGVDSESGGPRPPSGPAAGESLLIFPAGNHVVGWKLE